MKGVTKATPARRGWDARSRTSLTLRKRPTGAGRHLMARANAMLALESWKGWSKEDVYVT